LAKPAYLKAVCDGIANALIPHLVTNIQVNSGQTVGGATGPTSIPGTPTPILPAGCATFGNGTIS
jgi:hypothetical protein